MFLGTEDFIKEEEEELFNTPAGKILLSVTTLALVSSLICFGYIYFFLKLNIFIKSILYQMSVLGILGSGIMLVAEGIIQKTQNQSFTTCLMIHYTSASVASLGIAMTTMISALR